MQGDKEDQFPRYLSFSGWAESYYSCRFFDEKGPSWIEVLLVHSLNSGKKLFPDSVPYFSFGMFVKNCLNVILAWDPLALALQIPYKNNWTLFSELFYNKIQCIVKIVLEILPQVHAHFWNLLSRYCFPFSFNTTMGTIHHF